MKGQQRVYIAISVGPIAHLGGTETLQREIERYGINVFVRNGMFLYFLQWVYQPVLRFEVVCE